MTLCSSEPGQAPSRNAEREVVVAAAKNSAKRRAAASGRNPTLLRRIQEEEIVKKVGFALGFETACGGEAAGRAAAGVLELSSQRSTPPTINLVISVPGSGRGDEKLNLQCTGQALPKKN